MERAFLSNIEDIAVAALPMEKLLKYFTTQAAEDYLLKKIGLCQEMKQVHVPKQNFTAIKYML